MTVDPYDIPAWDEQWTCRHDYDPRWDYDDRLQPQHADHPLILLAQAELDALCAREDMPFNHARVFPVDLSADGHAARYVFGTAAAPVMLFDVAAHTAAAVVDPETETRRSVAHEIRHALQELEADGRPDFDEHDAESSCR